MSQDPTTGVAFEKGDVRGFLHMPARGSQFGLVITHGAGSNCQAPLLIAVASAFCDDGVSVLRCDLPFRQKRPKGPPSPAMAATDRAGLRSAVQVLRTLVPGRTYLGGHSYGGRQASMLAAEEAKVADALLLLSYPLHPPQKPDQLRSAHFPKIRMPTVFVHGTSDPFGTLDEMVAAVRMIPAPTLLLPIEGAGHDLKHGRFNLRALVSALRDNCSQAT
jgi:predicted alpha/beta-hydrolase family hydrolase